MALRGKKKWEPLSCERGSIHDVQRIPVPHLDVGDGRVERARPVDQPLAPVDHAFLVHTDEGLLHRVGQFL